LVGCGADGCTWVLGVDVGLRARVLTIVRVVVIVASKRIVRTKTRKVTASLQTPSLKTVHVEVIAHFIGKKYISWPIKSNACS
jgi:hypothetical protein